MDENAAVDADVAAMSTEELVSQFHVFQPYLCDLESRRVTLNRLRTECPVGHSKVFDGYWVISSYAGQQQVFRDENTFSSKIIIMPPLDVRDSFISVPIMMDGREHKEFRSVLLGAFTPRRVAALEPELREYTRKLAAEFASSTGPYDFLNEFATKVPAFGFLRIMGFPPEDLHLLLDFKDWLVHHQFSQEESVRARFQEVEAPQFMSYIQRHVDARRDPSAAPDDLLTKIVHSTVFGRAVTPDEIFRMLGTLIGGGLDTTRASLGLHFGWFAHNQDRWRELVEHPERIPTAVDEMLRCHALTSPARLVTADVEVGGQLIKKGELVQMPTGAASFDPDANPDPERVDFQRERIRHNTFAAGAHFCLGAGLARLTLEVAYQELVAVVHGFRVADGTVPRHHSGNVMGMDELVLQVA